MSDSGNPNSQNDLGNISAAFSAVDLAPGSNGSPGKEMLQHLISLFADTVPLSIWITDADGIPQFLNKHWYEFSGTSGLPAFAAEIAAASIHPEDGPRVMAAFEAARGTGQPFEIEQRNRAANGQYRWFLNRATPYRDPGSGDVMFWFGVGIDIHDRKIAEAKLEVNEERLRLVQAAGGIGSFDLDLQKDELSLSPETYAMFGLSDGSPIDQNAWRELLHPADLAGTFEALKKSIAERSTFDHEYRVIRPDNGEVRWIVSRASILTDGDGEPWRLIGGNVDITEQKFAREDERFLFEVTEAIRVARDSEALMEDISVKLGRYLALHRCLFNEIDQVSDTEIVNRDYARDGESVAGTHKISAYSSETTGSMSSGQTIVNHDSSKDPRTAEFFESTYKDAKELAYISVPMMRDGEWVASLWCSDDRRRTWMNREVALVENIAERTWAAVERLRAERAERDQLRKALDATAKFESVFNQSGQFAGILDLDGRLIEANDLALTQCGFTRDDVLGKPFWQTGWWAGSAEVQKLIRTAAERARSGESFRAILPFWWADGSEHIIDLALYPIKDENGKVIFLHPTGIDITERRAIEETVRQASLMPEQNPNPVMRISGSGEVLYFNAAASPLLEHWRANGDRIEKSLLEQVRECYASATRGQTEISFQGRTIAVYLAPIKDAGYVNIYGADITERISIEEELRRSEEAFRTLTNASPAIVWVSDPTGAVTYFNDRWFELTGLTPGRSVGDAWLAAVHPDDRQDLEAKWEASVSRGAPYEGECRYLNSRGEYRWHSFRALPRRESDGRISGWYGVSVDVHEARTAAERIKISEERYRALTELSPQMVYLTRPDGSITYVNQFTVEWTGKKLEDLQNDQWAKLIHPDHRERIFSVWKTAVAVESEYEIDVPLLHVDGTYRTLYNKAFPIKDENGKVLYWIGTALDVEDRRRAEENLRESEQRFRQVSDSAPVLIWMTDAEKSFVWFNKPWLDFSGRRIEDETGSGWQSGLHPDDRERFENIFSMSFASKQEFAMELRLRRADGEYRWVLNQGVPRLTPAGTLLGYIGSCVDIHDRKATESALRRSEARLQLATQIGNYGTWDINFVEDQEIWSEKMFEIFGIRPTADRKITKSIYEPLIYAEDLSALHKTDSEAKANGGSFGAEYRIRRADTGETRWLDVAAHYFYDPEGKPRRVVGIAQDITERKLANEAIRASEERFKLAQEAGNVGVWDWDAASNTTFWSDRMWALYGEEPQADVPRGGFWADRVFPNDNERLQAVTNAAVEGRVSTLKEEFRINRSDGELRWLELIATIEFDDNGSPARMYGVNLDITERKNFAERLRSSEAQLRLVTDSIPALVSYIDKNERYMFVNERYSEWFGIDVEKVVGRTMTEVLGERARAQLGQNIEAVLSGESVSFESWLDYSGAGRKYVHVSYVSDLSEEGEVAGFYALVTDITAQKISEEKLRLTEDRMRTISESFTDYAIISMDAEGKIDSWNHGAENIFGFGTDEIVGRPGSVLFTPEDVEAGVYEAELRQARESGRSSDERWHVRKDGTRFFASGVTAPLFVDDELIGYAKISTDLTEKKRSAEALQRAYDEMENRVLDRTKELASMNEALMREISERQTAERQKIELLKRLVSSQEEERRRIARDLHDHLGQRLTALRLKLASLRDACKADEEIFERATRLQQIAELIDSEVSFLAWELRPSTLDELGFVDAIGAFVKEWSRHYEIDAEFHSAITVEARLDRDAETHLYRITQEGLNNIYKHAHAKNVSVIIERAGGEIVLIIEDDGAGFAQAEGRKDRKVNRGLGLNGMRERADLIGGSLDIESEVGKGTTLYVRIPIVTEQRNHQ